MINLIYFIIRNDYIIGETVYFSVLIENSSDSSITVTSISVFIYNLFYNRLWIFLSIHKRLLLKSWIQLRKLILFLNLFNYIIIQFVHFGIQGFFVKSGNTRNTLVKFLLFSIKITIHYTDAVKSSILTGELSFTTVKPFTLAFTRYPMSDTSYLIHSIITNNMKQPLTITKVEIYNLLPSLQETYNSFSEYFLVIIYYLDLKVFNLERNIAIHVLLMVLFNPNLPSDQFVFISKYLDMKKFNWIVLHY